MAVKKSKFKKYTFTQKIQARPYLEKEDVSKVFISKEDIKNKHPKVGDFIAFDESEKEKLFLLKAKDLELYKKVTKKKIKDNSYKSQIDFLYNYFLNK